jgi:hypothetical protein
MENRMFKHGKILAGGLLTVVAAVGVAFSARGGGQAEKDPHLPKVVKLSELIKEIQAFKGKVVVMDAWNDG